jgi:hypothetical protein
MRLTAVVLLASALVAGALALGGASLCACNQLSNGTFTGGGVTVAPVVAAPEPVVVITSPARGSFFAPGPVTVTGYTAPAVTGGAAIVALQVNDVPTALAFDGTFSTTVTLTAGLNVLRASVADAANGLGFSTCGVIAGQFLPPGVRVPGALQLRLNTAGMSGLEAIMENAVDTVSSATLATSPILNDSLGPLAIVASITDLRYGAVHVRLDPQGDGLHMSAQADAPIVVINANITLNGVPFDQETATILADSVSVTARVVPEIVNADGLIELEVLGTQVSLPNLHIQSPSPVITNLQALIYNFAQQTVEGIVGGIVDQLTPAPVNPILLNVLGAEATFDIRGQSMNFDSGGFQGIVTSDIIPVTWTAAGLAAPGSLYTAGTPPVVQNGYGLEVSINEDLFNRIGYGLWAAGALKFDMAELGGLLGSATAGTGTTGATGSTSGGATTTPGTGGGVGLAGHAPAAASLTSTDLISIIPEFAGVLPDGAPVNIVGEALLPPVFRVAAPPDVLAVEWGEVHIDLQCDRGHGFESILKVAAHLSISANVSLDSTGLALSSGATPSFIVDVIDMPLVTIERRQIEIALSLLLTPGVPFFVNNAKFPIPQLASLSVIGASAFGDGLAGDYVSVVANLAR